MYIDKKILDVKIPKTINQGVSVQEFVRSHTIPNEYNFPVQGFWAYWGEDKYMWIGSNLNVKEECIEREAYVLVDTESAIDDFLQHKVFPLYVENVNNLKLFSKKTKGL